MTVREEVAVRGDPLIALAPGTHKKQSRLHGEIFLVKAVRDRLLLEDGSHTQRSSSPDSCTRLWHREREAEQAGCCSDSMSLLTLRHFLTRDV